MSAFITTPAAVDSQPNSRRAHRGRRWRQRWLVSAVVFGLALAIAGAVLLRGVTLPAPTGTYPVGRTTFRWTDTSRLEAMTDDPNDHRAAVVHVWYPAAATSTRGANTYLPDVAALRPSLAASPEFGPLNAWVVSLVHAHAHEGAAPAEGAEGFPVLVFLPGNRTNAGLYSLLLEDLASHGYVVAAIDHPYDVEAVRLPEGGTATFAAERWPAVPAGIAAENDARAQFYRERVEVRAQDAAFVVAQLAQVAGDSRLPNHLDLTRVGVLGHSVGGVAAARACQLISACRGSLNLDGLAAGMPFYLDDDGHGPTQPFLLLTKPVETPPDGDLARWGLSRAEWETGAATAEARLLARLETVRGASYRVVVAGAAHDSFTDTPLLRPTLFNASRAQATYRVALVRAYTRHFFDSSVRPATPVHMTALPEFPGATFEVVP